LHHRPHGGLQEEGAHRLAAGHERGAHVSLASLRERHVRAHDRIARRRHLEHATAADRRAARGAAHDGVRGRGTRGAGGLQERERRIDEERRGREESEALRHRPCRDLRGRGLVAGERQRLDELIHPLEHLHAAGQGLALTAHLLEREVRRDRGRRGFGEHLAETHFASGPVARRGGRQDELADELATVDERDEESRADVVLAAQERVHHRLGRDVLDDHGPARAHRALARRVAPAAVGDEWLDRPVDPDRVPGLVGFRAAEEEHPVDAERAPRGLVHGAQQLAEVAGACDRERGRARDLQLLVLKAQLVGSLTERGAGLLHGPRDERGHRDERDEGGEADGAKPPEAGVPPREKPVADEDGHVEDETDGADDDRARDAHRERRRERREEEEDEVRRRRAPREHEQHRADDLRDARPDREAQAPEDRLGDRVEPEDGEDAEQRRAEEQPDARDGAGRRQRRGSDEEARDAPGRHLGREPDAALVAALDVLPRRHSGNGAITRLACRGRAEVNFLKIAKLATHVLEGKAERAIQFGAGSYGTFTATLVEITTDDGITGVGECIARRAPRVVDTVVRDLLWPVIEGRDPRDVAGLWDGMFARLRPWGHDRGFVHEGISGVDQALWDILAQAEGVPLYKALRGAGRDRVPVYGSKVYTADLPAMAREAEAAVKRGHKALKVQLGRSAELGGPNADVEVCRVIREAIGPDIEMGADVNSAYDAGTAIRVCERIAKYDLWFLEEPVFPDDLDGYERIRRVSSVPLACGESEFGTFGFRELFRRGLIDIAQPDV